MPPKSKVSRVSNGDSQAAASVSANIDVTTYKRNSRKTDQLRSPGRTDQSVLTPRALQPVSKRTAAAGGRGADKVDITNTTRRGSVWWSDMEPHPKGVSMTVVRRDYFPRMTAFEKVKSLATFTAQHRHYRHTRRIPRPAPARMGCGRQVGDKRTLSGPAVMSMFTSAPCACYADRYGSRQTECDSVRTAPDEYGEALRQQRPLWCGTIVEENGGLGRAVRRRPLH